MPRTPQPPDDRFERDTYQAYLSAVEPVRLNRLTWVVVSVATGILLGSIAAAPDTELGPLLLGAGVLAFMVVSIVRPYLAVQVFLVVLFSGWGNTLVVDLPGTTLGGGIPFVVLLGFGWLVGGAHMPSFSMRGSAVPLGLLLLMFVAFELIGSARDNLWLVAQGDIVPALALASFIPIAAAMRTEREVRGIVLAAAVGIALLAVRAIAAYVGHFDAGATEITTPYFRILGEQGLAGGPRVLPGFHRGVLYMVGLVGVVVTGRSRGGGGLPAPVSILLAGLFVMALLVGYSRSIILTTGGALIAAVLLLRKQPKLIVRAALWVGALTVLLALTIPLLTGQRPGSVIDALRQRFTDVTQDASYTDRLAEDREGLQAFGEHPLVGLGLGADVVVPEFPNRLPGYFHNAYVGLLVKTGIVGTAIFVGVYLALLWRAARIALRSSGLSAAVLSAGAAGLLGLMVASISEPFVLFPPGYEYVALLAALTSFYESRLQGDEPLGGASAEGDEVAAEAGDGVETGLDVSPSRSR